MGFIARTGQWFKPVAFFVTLLLVTGNTLAAPQYVGGETCVACHEQETSKWTDSHHDLAMQEPTDKTVLGNFEAGSFDYRGVTTTFFKRQGEFFVRTDNSQGQLQEFKVAYTFGVYPLQQYLLPLPGGRLQALGIAWDSRPATVGGQRWFHLYAEQNVDFQDPLHWTGRLQNWNYMCAECHSTHLEKNFSATDNRYATTWSELNVSCEACHGPGSSHLQWASKDQPDSTNKGLTHTLDRSGISWQPNPETGIPEGTGTGHSTEIETCGACHARRTQLFEDDRQGQNLLQSFLPALIQQGIYHSDGQIDAEVYVYGSFGQSKMYDKGVTCSDCHDPHSTKLRAEGNGVCLQCHGAVQYNTRSHHFHDPASAAGACVACHMPSKTYMQVDVRHDHSFRIPDPALSEAEGVPNACTQCHEGSTNHWAATQVNKWYGKTETRYQAPAKVLAAARAGAGNAHARLLESLNGEQTSAILTATMAYELSLILDPAAAAAIMPLLANDDALVRATAVLALESLPVSQRFQALAPLLQDTSRVVRSLVGRALADVPLNQLPADLGAQLQSGWDLFVASQQFNADDPAALTNLGNFYARQQALATATDYFQQALALDPLWIPAYVNYADLLRATNRDNEGLAVLQQGLAVLPDAADLQHSLGLLYVRQKRLDPAIVALARAAELAPANVRYTYVYIVALNSLGRRAEALTILDKAAGRFPLDASLQQLQNQLR
jgi:predicted CXXCH cytochrome family protein